MIPFKEAKHNNFRICLKQKSEIGCKSIYRKEYKANVSADKHKMRPVAKGFTKKNSKETLESLKNMYKKFKTYWC